MANREEQSKELYDAFLSMEMGVNTDIAPFLLPKNQLGGAVNASMRGTFVVPRPPYVPIKLAPVLPQALFQGACFYKPDSGLESIVCSIGGRLFQITPNPVAAASAAAFVEINTENITAAAAATAAAEYATAQAAADQSLTDYNNALNAYSEASSALSGAQYVNKGGQVALQAAVTAAQTTLSVAFQANQQAQSAAASAQAVANTASEIAGNAASAVAAAEAGIDATNPITSATVTEITIPGDPNPAQNQMAWMWQAEKWVITNDGVSIPIFSNLTDPPNSVQNPGANVSRRAVQQPNQLYTITGGFTAPGNQNTVNVTLSANYTGGLNMPIVVSSAPATSLIEETDIYTASPVTGALLTLQNLSGRAGAIVPPGTQLYKDPNFVGFVTSVVLGNTVSHAANIVFSILDPFVSGLLGGPSYTYEWNVTFAPECPAAPGAPIKTAQIVTTTNTPPVLVGAPYYSSSTIARNVVATTEPTSAGQFIVPPVKSTVIVALKAPYNGNIGDDLFTGSGQIMQVVAINNNVTNVVSLTQQWNDSGTHPSYASGTPVYPQTLGDELPPGRMGVYGLGQNWISLTDGRSFMCGDLVGYFSGTASNNFRDSVLKVTQNTQLADGGNFVVPQNQGEIEALAFCANLDVSLGQGPLQVLTDYAVYSCQVALGNNNWLSVTNPILTQSLIANGSVSMDGTGVSNSDIIFRSPDGVRSLILGRRDFNTWGNVPISVEVSAYLKNDNPALLQYCSSIEFDNRRLITCNPQQGSLGVYHNQMVVINYDPISTMQGKKPSIWEGVWKDLNVLKLIAGRFAGTPRAFAFNYNLTSQTIELWEILPSTAVATTPIQTVIELPVMNFGEKDPRIREWKRLQDGEVYMDRINGPVDVKAQFRPDYDSVYRNWIEFTIPGAPSYQPRVGLGKPPQEYDANSEDGGTGRFYSSGFSFQPKLTFTGTGWRLMGGRMMAFRAPQPQFPPVIPKTPPA